MTVALIGDQHGNINNFLNVLNHLHLNHPAAKTLIQVGDFGMMGDGFEKYLFKINERLIDLGLKLFVIDGNHDNHAWLRKQLGDNDEVDLLSHITYLKRGAIKTIEGTNYLFMGGAHSIDRLLRRKNKTYWEEETISNDDLDYAIANVEKFGQPIDVLVCHDVPSDFTKITSGYLYDPLLSLNNRLRLTSLLNASLPDLVIHGHYHKRVTDLALVSGKQIEAICLNRDGSPTDEQFVII